MAEGSMMLVPTALETSGRALRADELDLVVRGDRSLANDIVAAAPVFASRSRARRRALRAD
jgi:hypothetical protein